MALQNLRSSTPSKRPNASSMADGQIALNTAAASAGLFFKDSNGDLVKTGPVHIGTTAPNSTPATGGSTGNSKGEAWLDTSNNNYVLKIYDGTAWQSVEIAPGSARQLLQTNAAGTDVEFTSNVDVPGTLDVTGATTLDSTASVAGLLSANGKISFAEGNSAAPGIYPGSDTDTGISSPSLDTLSLSTAGTSRLYIDSSGDVGIGTTNPVGDFVVSKNGGEGFEITPTLNSVELKTYDRSLSAFIDTRFIAGQFRWDIDGTEAMRIDSNGNVGIGTSSPAGTLNVLGNQIASPSRFYDTANILNLDYGGTQLAFGVDPNSPYGCYIQGRDNTDTAKPILLNAAGGNVGIGTTNPGATLDVKGGAMIGAADTSDAELQIGSGATGNRNSFIDFIGDLTYTDYGFRVIRENAGANADSALRHRGTGALKIITEEAAPITFRTTNAERMRIDSSGNVGIGTTSPSDLLHISDDGGAGILIERTGAPAKIQTSFGGGDAAFKYTVNNASSYIVGIDDSDSDKFKISYGGSDNAAFGTNDRVVVNSSGNVGIGTSSPVQKLTISGTASNTMDETTGTLRLQATGGNGLLFGTHATSPFTSYIQSAFVADTSLARYALSLNPIGGGVGIGTTLPERQLQIGDNTVNSSNAISFGKRVSATQSNKPLIGQTSDGTSNDLGLCATSSGGAIRFFTGNDASGFGAGNNNERMRVSNIGELFVGVTSGGSSGATTGTVKARAYNTRTGHSGSFGGNVFNIYWTGSVARLYIDNTNVGTFSFTSDYRVKDSVASISSNCIDRIKQLRPVQYQYTDYQDVFIGDSVTREGFIAHEVAEVIPSGVDGAKDDPDQMQSLKVDAILSVTVKALQEAVAKIEALEQRLADAGL